MTVRLLLFFLIGCGQALGQLAWDHVQIDLHPRVDETKVTANYTFENKGAYPIVKVMPNIPVNILKVTSSNSEFKTELRAVVSGAVYQIVVTPPDALQAGQSIIRIESDYPKGSPRIYTVLANIKS